MRWAVSAAGTYFLVVVKLVEGESGGLFSLSCEPRIYHYTRCDTLAIGGVLVCLLLDAGQGLSLSSRSGVIFTKVALLRKFFVL